MVKGNAQRRLELLERRKAELQEEKVRRSAGPISATPAEARARLLSDARGVESGLVAWCTVDDDKWLCDCYFRTGTCPLKRCKFSHEVSISDVKGVPASPCSTSSKSSGSDGVAPMIEKPLRQVDAGGAMVYDPTIRSHVRSESRLRFVVWMDRLVFDFANPSVFAEYCASCAPQPGRTPLPAEDTPSGAACAQAAEYAEPAATEVEQPSYLLPKQNPPMIDDAEVAQAALARVQLNDPIVEPGCAAEDHTEEPGV